VPRHRAARSRLPTELRSEPRPVGVHHVPRRVAHGHRRHGVGPEPGAQGMRARAGGRPRHRALPKQGQPPPRQGARQPAVRVVAVPHDGVRRGILPARVQDVSNGGRVRQGAGGRPRRGGTKCGGGQVRGGAPARIHIFGDRSVTDSCSSGQLRHHVYTLYIGFQEFIHFTETVPGHVFIIPTVDSI
jgi:hypothetical protein